ncbi:MAG: hypothetical protein LVR00_01820 [Rhabdochlamydiaceae bacterium]|jgi:hypothetical protein
MEKQKLRGVLRGLMTGVTGLLCLVSPFALYGASSKESSKSKNSSMVSWKEFHSVAGKCKVTFPDSPEHVSENLRMPEGGYELKYDAYISSMDQQTVFMLLIAQYPDFVDSSYAQMSLESFLNGILTHNNQNQLIFADLILINGNPGMDFFIRTGGVYFKGRAIMVKNSLYLMAMECEIKNYDEVHFKNFVESFKLLEDDTIKTTRNK